MVVDMDRYVVIGNKIREAREARGLSQAELGRLIGYSDVAIGNWEKGRRKINIEDLEQIASALGKPISYFLDIEDKLRNHPNINMVLTDLKVKVLPVLATVPAGKPIMVQENIVEYLAVPEHLARSADFMIQVKGDSMIEKGILEGDYLLIRRQPKVSIR